MLKRTALYDVHARAGASFTDFGGWDMPLRYTSDVAEHHSVRQHCGIFDLSHMGEVWVQGPEAGKALDYALVGPVSALAVGRAKYMMITHPNGTIMDDLIVYRLDSERFLVVPNAGNALRVTEALRERCTGCDCMLTDASASTALIAVQGPDAAALMSQALTHARIARAALRPRAQADGIVDGSSDEVCDLDGAGVATYLRYYAACQAVLADCDVLVARTGYTGEDGFEIFCDAADAVTIWDAIVAVSEHLHDVSLMPCGLASRDSLRLEAGMPLYGHELTDDLTPYDVGLGMVLKPEGDFVGAQALSDRAGRDGEPGTYVLTALVGQGRRAARAGYALYRPGTDECVGEVTSGLLSPTLGYPVALARMVPYRVGEPSWPIDDVVEVDVRGKRMTMRVVQAPFYRRPR